MSNQMSVTRATAIAATNAVVKHLKLGLFMSEFNSISDYSLRFCKLAGNAQVQISGRSNAGTWVFVSNTVIYKQDRNGQFPIEKVYVSVHNPDREGHTDEHDYFECIFGEDIVVQKMERSPHEDLSTQGVHVSDVDDSPDAWATRYPH